MFPKWKIDQLTASVVCLDSALCQGAGDYANEAKFATFPHGRISTAGLIRYRAVMYEADSGTTDQAVPGLV